MSERFEQLCRATNAALEEILKKGTPPSPEALAGYEWRGFNTPPYTAALGIRKFIKGFFSGPGGLEGYNIPARQNGLTLPWIHKPDAARPHRFGFYKVGPAPDRYPKSLLLDYGASPRNPAWRPERLLRDYLVQDGQDADVMIGKAYLALGTLVPVGYFILERLRASAWAADA